MILQVIEKLSHIFAVFVNIHSFMLEVFLSLYEKTGWFYISMADFHKNG